MISRSSKQFLLLFPCLFLVLIARTAAHGCSCGPRPTTLDSYDGSDVVVITRLLSVEKVPVEKAQNTEDRYYPDGIRSATMMVEKVFKGHLKVRDEIVLGQGSGADCIWSFEEQWIGEQFLFYLGTPKKGRADDYPPFSEPHWWHAGTCGRSRKLEQATEDLLYLENMAKLRGKSRISGTIGARWGNPDIDVENKKIKIIGAKKTYHVKTDAKGVFEIYDVPPGEYLIEPETPSGYRVQSYPSLIRDLPTMDRTGEGEAKLKKNQVPIVLEPKKHTSVNIYFVIDNAVRGKVTDPSGKPLRGVSVRLLERNQKEEFGPIDYTNEKGEFVITQVPIGEYILAVNEGGELSASQPFKTLYYPNVTERDRAAVITIGPGGLVSDINIVVPKLEETIIVEGVLKYSDGKPVAEETVRFEAEESEGINGGSSAETDAEGRFSMRLLKGVKGELLAEDYVYVGEYVDCPKRDSFIKQSGKDSLTVKTNVVRIVAEQNIFDLELTFPFPKCEKAKP